MPYDAPLLNSIIRQLQERYLARLPPPAPPRWYTLYMDDGALLR